MQKDACIRMGANHILLDAQDIVWYNLISHVVLYLNGAESYVRTGRE